MAKTQNAATTILEHAVALFADKGFSAVSLSEIARHSGTSKANIIHHFKSKDALYLAVLQHACQQSAQALDEIEQRNDLNPRHRLALLFQRHLELLLDHPQATRLLQRELLECGAGCGRTMAEAVVARHFSRLVELLREGQKQGLVRDDIDPALLAFLMVSANLYFFEAREVLRYLPEVDFAEEPKRYSKAVFDLLERGFAPPEEQT